MSNKWDSLSKQDRAKLLASAGLPTGLAQLNWSGLQKSERKKLEKGSGWFEAKKPIMTAKGIEHKAPEHHKVAIKKEAGKALNTPMGRKEELEIPETVLKAQVHSITDTGQLTKEELRDLNKFVKKGILIKGQGGIYPKKHTVYAQKGYDIADERRRGIDELLKGQDVALKAEQARRDNHIDILTDEQHKAADMDYAVTFLHKNPIPLSDIDYYKGRALNRHNPHGISDAVWQEAWKKVGGVGEIMILDSQGNSISTPYYEGGVMVNRKYVKTGTTKEYVLLAHKTDGARVMSTTASTIDKNYTDYYRLSLLKDNKQIDGMDFPVKDDIFAQKEIEDRIEQIIKRNNLIPSAVEVKREFWNKKPKPIEKKPDPTPAERMEQIIKSGKEREETEAEQLKKAREKWIAEEKTKPKRKGARTPEIEINTEGQTTKKEVKRELTKLSTAFSKRYVDRHGWQYPTREKMPDGTYTVTWTETVQEGLPVEGLLIRGLTKEQAEDFRKELKEKVKSIKVEISIREGAGGKYEIYTQTAINPISIQGALKLFTKRYGAKPKHRAKKEPAHELTPLLVEYRCGNEPPVKVPIEKLDEEIERCRRESASNLGVPIEKLDEELEKIKMKGHLDYHG